MEIAELEAKARWVRRTVFEMIVNAKKGHLGGSLSCVDIMVALFYQIMKPEDVFILSKGHAAPVLYAILADKGYFPKEELMTFNLPKSRLEGHPHIGIPGVFCNTGSLGNGLGIACGAAMARPDIKVYVLEGDGECDEGAVYEARNFIIDHHLTNVVELVDYNGFRATNAVNRTPHETLKGKGVSFMENKAEWHHKIPNTSEIEQARRELVY
uniref:Putative transketolase domain containing protein n=1 Tax=viral metagenome TaxID=1070528 RepID=A0A6M3L624_9ZZZZ